MSRVKCPHCRGTGVWKQNLGGGALFQDCVFCKGKRLVTKEVRQKMLRKFPHLRFLI